MSSNKLPKLCSLRGLRPLNTIKIFKYISVAKTKFVKENIISSISYLNSKGFATVMALTGVDTFS